LGAGRGREEKMFVGGVYLVPASSTRKWKAREIIGEIGKDIARFTQEGHVVLAGDWNCKIGRLASIAGGQGVRQKKYVTQSRH